jgi:hypothetical protein
MSHHVLVEYVSSSFIRTSVGNEMAILQHVFEREQRVATTMASLEASTTLTASTASTEFTESEESFNVIVDLCGIFKRSSIYDVRDLVLRLYGPNRFHYIYHIGQADSSDRVLSVNSDNDVQFDEEFYKFLVKTYGVELRHKVFFFVDNRNVIGKDVPFQLLFRKSFGVPLFSKSAVLAHDVDDFSKIWQAMGRSRTMNDTRFSIYTSRVSSSVSSDGDVHQPDGGGGLQAVGLQDIKTHPLTRELYVRNCDQKMAGNLSSIYQTLISLLNVAKDKFYYSDEIVNVFLEKMQMTIGQKVERHQQQLERSVLGEAATAQIFTHILHSKFQRSPIPAVQQETLSRDVVETLLGHIVMQKYEQRELSDDLHDDFIQLLSGEQESLMEISYSKQQQKQKQKQRNRNQDSDTMDMFQDRNRLHLFIETDNYYEYAAKATAPENDEPRITMQLPITVPIVTITYIKDEDGHQREKVINVYPTVQFLYSHHIQADYITEEVKANLQGGQINQESFQRFLDTVVDQRVKTSSGGDGGGGGDSSNSSSSSSTLNSGERKDDHGSGDRRSSDSLSELKLNIERCFVRQNPQYTIAALQEGIYVIGMKDQFNIYDLPSHPLHEHVRYIADEMGFILYSKDDSDSAVASVDTFGPYFIEQYILMEVLSKQEVAQNVLDYYLHHKDQLQTSLKAYGGAQGKGFICWRFLMNEAVKAAKAAALKVAEGDQSRSV